MSTPLDQLQAEWRRFALLLECVADQRAGRESAAATLLELAELQSEVQNLRTDGTWFEILGHELHHLAYEILVAAMAREAEPRLAWLIQDLQPGIVGTHPTPALIIEAAALDQNQARTIIELLAPDAHLRTAGLIHIEKAEPFTAIQPGQKLKHALLGRQNESQKPPGTTAITLRPSWEELILPEAQTTMLREFQMWIKHADTVYGQWGARDIGGPIALFAGPSGTGKTFAASVLAADLGYDLYRIDLSAIISKYIGETEKNLNALFDAAHQQPMILQFDEADSLFGKRGDVKEARDRYANMEVNFLLARIENHKGPCILTSNLQRHIDPAFARRFQAVIPFTRPDVEQRTILWRNLLPPKAPLAEEVDCAFLGAAVNLTGGSIRNAALHAAFMAADDDVAIGYRHISAAVWRELGKDGSEVSEEDLGSLQRYLEVPR